MRPGGRGGALIAAGSLALVAASAFVLWRQLYGLPAGAIAAALARLTGGRWLAACLGVVVSFGLNGLVEWRALRWTKARPPLWAVLHGAFTAGAISHCLGANLLVAGVIRARLYGRYGVRAQQIAAATLYQGGAFALGLACLAGWGLLAGGPGWGRAAGAALLAAVGAYLAACALWRRPLAWRGRRLRAPSLWDGLLQTVLGALDTTVSIAILWSLLPGGQIDFARFAPTYAGGYVAGLLSGAPGGLGVFEAAVLSLSGPVGSAGLGASLAAAFLAYRLIFYIAPLAVGALLLGADLVGFNRAATARPTAS